MLEIDAVAFDLDGTLYPNCRFYIRVLPFVLKEQKMLRAFGKARDILRACLPEDPLLRQDFYEAQASLMGKMLGEDAKAVRDRAENLIYHGWEPLFKKVKLFPRVHESLSALKAKGLKLGLLSDFPPEQKLKNLGLEGPWDTVLCSEKIGRLKPDPRSFLELARKLGAKPERTLYVGNSVHYDVVGAKNVGMKAALVVPFLLKKFVKPADNTTFVFSDYRQLTKYVLE
jgi:putative hydrolase of the HAD superfamily